MRKLFQISVLSLLMLATLSFSDSGNIMAQGKSHKQHEKGYKHTKGGPPDWAPAHGWRRKQGSDNDKRFKHKAKKEDKAYKQHDVEYKHKEERSKRREKSQFPDSREKKRPEGELKKRRESAGEILKRRSSDAEGKIEQKQEKERRQQEEVQKKTPLGKKEGDWTGGSGW